MLFDRRWDGGCLKKKNEEKTVERSCCRPCRGEIGRERRWGRIVMTFGVESMGVPTTGEIRKMWASTFIQKTSFILTDVTVQINQTTTSSKNCSIKLSGQT